MPPNSPPPAAPQPQPAPQPDQPQPTHPQYDFIMNPAPPPRRSFSLPGGENKLLKLAYLGGGLLILFILFSFVKGLVTSGPNLAPFITVTQDQQAMLHVVANASQQQNLNTVNQNFIATSKLSLTTAQSQIITYLATQHKKVGKKTLNLKLSATTDARLLSSAAAATYNPTFKEIMEGLLNTYLKDLNQAYEQTDGKNGRALLKSDYAQAQLLLKQLQAPST